ncbi:hypothetical protein Tcan_01591, partial [Toxocara canis]
MGSPQLTYRSITSLGMAPNFTSVRSWKSSHLFASISATPEKTSCVRLLKQNRLSVLIASSASTGLPMISPLSAITVSHPKITSYSSSVCRNNFRFLLVPVLFGYLPWSLYVSGTRSIRACNTFITLCFPLI